MAIITNTHKTALSVRDVTLQPNTPTPVHNWDQMSKNAVVAAWVKAGILKVEDASAGNQGSKFEQPDRDELVAKLAALGVKHHPNTGVLKLQAMLAEAEEKKRAEDDAALSNLVFEMSGLSVEEWEALPEEDRAQRITDHRASLETKD